MAPLRPGAPLARWTFRATPWAAVVLIGGLGCGDDATGPPAPPPPAPVATTVAVTPASAVLLFIGESVQLSAEVRDQAGRAMPGAAVTWTSSDLAVASVDASGLATAAGGGTATVTAASGSASGTAQVSVEPSAAAVWRRYLAGESLNPAEMSVLPESFSGALELGLHEELDSALVRLVRETPALPASSGVPRARLAAIVGETLGPHDWPEPHPWAAAFPGLPRADAPRVDGSVTVDAGRSEFSVDASRRLQVLPLGFYAPPSAAVEIELPPSHATGELRVAVGELHDNLRQGYAAQPEWRRPPQLYREFIVQDPHTGVTNAYGGSIYLVVPPDYTGTVPVTVRGAIPMAVYTAGSSSGGEWLADLDAGAPQAIIQKPGGIRLVLSAERAAAVADPEEVAEFWDGFQRLHADLAGEPAPRAYESVWIFDPQVGWGYANASARRINYPLHAEHWVLVPGTAEGRRWLATLPERGPTRHLIPAGTGYSPWTHGVDWWLFGHELGHQWQTADWGFSENTQGIIEVAVNLFTMYTLNRYVFGGGDSTLVSREDRSLESVDHAALAGLSWPSADVWERLSLYRQLILEFSWDPIRRVFHSYFDPDYPRSVYGGELDGFAIRFSAMVERDMVAFFRRWDYPLSASAAATIRSFGFEAWLPPGW